MDFLNQTLLGNELNSWLIAVGITLGVYIVLTLIKRLFHHRLTRLVAKSRMQADDFLIPVLDQTRWFSFIALGMLLGAQYLQLPGEVDLWFGRVMRIVLSIQLGLWGTGLIGFYIERSVDAKIDQDHGEDATTLDALGLMLKIALWVILALIILDNLNIEINSLITSLGIGGIAVALAVQHILGDLFSSLSISLDKPFAIGDFIVVGDFEGDVEDIGLKSTRVRALSGEEVIFANSDLLNSRIRNYKRLEERRISFSFGVVYGIPSEKLEAIPGMVEEIIAPLENVRYERTHLKNLGDFALEYSVVYFVLVPDYASYLDIQQQINLALYRRFEEEGIEFAYPTQTVVLDQE
ncbi:MAG: mechanosensitive ion channel family protein [Anaerolineales bacterium]|jgi:small-conductance mechanosensitive channel